VVGERKYLSLSDTEPAQPPRRLVSVLTELPWLPEVKYNPILVNIRA
jgi:hypothetical protein